MHYSNSKIRKNTILKALLFTVFPMVLTGLAVYLLCCKSGAIESGNSRAMKKEKELFVDALNTINENWKQLLVNYERLIENKEHASSSALNRNVSNSEGKLLNNISIANKEFSDTAFVAKMEAMNLNFEHYFEQMEKFRLENDDLMKELEKCEGGGTGNNTLCEIRIAQKEQEIARLTNSLSGIIEKHKEKIKAALEYRNVLQGKHDYIINSISSAQ